MCSKQTNFPSSSYYRKGIQLHSTACRTCRISSFLVLHRYDSRKYHRQNKRQSPRYSTSVHTNNRNSLVLLSDSLWSFARSILRSLTLEDALQIEGASCAFLLSTCFVVKPVKLRPPTTVRASLCHSKSRLQVTTRTARASGPALSRQLFDFGDVIKDSCLSWLKFAEQNMTQEDLW